MKEQRPLSSHRFFSSENRESLGLMRVFFFTDGGRFLLIFYSVFGRFSKRRAFQQVLNVTRNYAKLLLVPLPRPGN